MCVRDVSVLSRVLCFLVLLIGSVSGAVAQQQPVVYAETVSEALRNGTLALRPVVASEPRLSYAGGTSANDFYLRHFTPVLSDGTGQSAWGILSYRRDGSFRHLVRDEGSDSTIWNVMEDSPQLSETLGSFGFLIYMPKHVIEDDTLARWSDADDGSRVVVRGVGMQAADAQEQALVMLHCLQIGFSARRIGEDGNPEGRLERLTVPRYLSDDTCSATPDFTLASPPQGSFWAEAEVEGLDDPMLVLVLQGENEVYEGPLVETVLDPQMITAELYIRREGATSEGCNAIFGGNVFTFVSIDTIALYDQCVLPIFDGERIAPDDLPLPTFSELSEFANESGRVAIVFGLTSPSDESDGSGETRGAEDVGTRGSTGDEGDLQEQVFYASFRLSGAHRIASVLVRQGDFSVTYPVENRDAVADGGVLEISVDGLREYIVYAPARDGFGVGQVNVSVNRSELEPSQPEFTCSQVTLPLNDRQISGAVPPEVTCEERLRATTVVLPESITPTVRLDPRARVTPGICPGTAAPPELANTQTAFCVSGYARRTGASLAFDVDGPDRYTVDEWRFSPSYEDASNGTLTPTLLGAPNGGSVDIVFDGVTLDSELLAGLEITASDANVGTITVFGDGSGVSVPLNFPIRPIESWLSRETVTLTLEAPSGEEIFVTNGVPASFKHVNVTIAKLIAERVTVQGPTVGLPARLALIDAVPEQGDPIYYCDFGIRIGDGSPIWYEADPGINNRIVAQLPEDIASAPPKLATNDRISLITRPRNFPEGSRQATQARACMAEGTVFETLPGTEFAALSEVSVPYGPLIITYFLRGRGSDADYGGQQETVYRGWLAPVAALRSDELVVLRRADGRGFVTRGGPTGISPYGLTEFPDALDRLNAADAPNLEQVLEDAEALRRAYLIPDGQTYGIVVLRSDLSRSTCASIERSMRNFGGTAHLIVLEDSQFEPITVRGSGDNEFLDWKTTRCSESVTLVRTNTMYLFERTRRHVDFQRALSPELERLRDSLR